MDIPGGWGRNKRQKRGGKEKTRIGRKKNRLGKHRKARPKQPPRGDQKKWRGAIPYQMSTGLVPGAWLEDVSLLAVATYMAQV